MKRKFILSLTAYALLLTFACAALTGCGTSDQLYSAALSSQNASNGKSASSSSSGKSASSSSGSNNPSSSSSSKSSSSSGAQITTLSVPSPYSYCGYTMSVGQKELIAANSSHPSYNLIILDALTLDEEDWVDEYLKYIEDNFDFKLVGHNEWGFEYHWFYDYYFEYTGSGNVTEYYNDDIKAHYNVNVNLTRYLDENRYAVSVRYPPEMTLGETNARTTKKLTNFNNGAASSGSSSSSASSSGSSGGGSYSSSSSSKKSGCNYCGGRGTRDCRTCDGKGYEEIRTSTPHYSGLSGSGGNKTTRKPCSNPLCHGGQVDCPFC